MNELINLQNKFQKYLMHSDHAIQMESVSTGKVPVEVRLEIYGHAYRSRLVEALAANYPILQIYLGDEPFEKLSHAYIDAHPSLFRNIRWFGNQLENFLTENADYSSYPYLAELAKLEWTMTLTFDAADHRLVTMEDIIHLPPEAWADMRLMAHPSTHLIHFSWNVVHLWQALSQEQQPCEPIQNERPTAWVFWRKDLINQYCSLPEDEAFAIDAMLKGMKFGEVCEGICQWINEEEAAIRAASLLKGWILSGLIVKIQGA